MARSSSQHKYEKIAVFAFGVIFITVILTLVVVNPYPSQLQFFVFRLILALSAAGVGALLPGFINIDLPLPMQGGLRAGGALALFASVWFVNPADIGVSVKPPVEDAGALINQLLDLSDAQDHKGAYSLFASRIRQQVSEPVYTSMLENVRDPLGSTEERILVAADTPNQIAGLPGPFVVHAYQTRFNNSDSTWVEVVVTIAEKGAWKIHGYTINKCIPPMCTPF